MDKMNQSSIADPNITRATLIQRVKNQHDEASWDDFVKTYKNYAYAIIRRMNISEQDADDLLQQVMVTIWKKLPQTDVDQIRRFRSWLATVTRNLVTDFIRKRTREAERMEKAGKEEILSYLHSIRLPDLDYIAEKEWKLHLTNLALKNIEPFFSGKAIEVFRLSLQGIPSKDIAQQLNLSESSIYRLKIRVKERLIVEIERLRTELE
jgi:RNA polymerase sigma-70 factor (ECF subfamily)